MRHDILLSRKAHGGATERDHLLHAARKGSESAEADLEGPELPEAVLYLKDWAYALYGRSGASMEGLAPLGYGTIEAWSRLTGIVPDPLEVQALITLDGVMRHPEEKKDEEPEPPPEEVAWPSKD